MYREIAVTSKFVPFVVSRSFCSDPNTSPATSTLAAASSPSLEMHRRRASDASLSSVGACSDADDGDKKKKKRNIFKNLIPKRRKPKLSSLDDADNVSGASWFHNPILTGEAEESSDIIHTEIIKRPSYKEPLPYSVGSLTSDPQPPKAPPRRRKQSPEKLPAPEESSLNDETLSPVEPLQCSRPVIHSRTSSHSSGFEEGSSSLTETSDASTWRDLIPRIADRVGGLRWTGESLGVRMTPANHAAREMGSSGDTSPKTAKSDSTTTCDEDFQVFSPEISLSVEEVLGEYFASKGSLLASFIHPEEDSSAPHSSVATTPVPDAQLVCSNNIENNRDSSDLISRENINARTSTYITIGQEARNLDSEAKQCISGRKPDLQTFPGPLKPDFGCDFEIRSSFNSWDRINNSFLRGDDKTNSESHLRSHGANYSSSSNGASKELLKCQVYNESKNVCSTQTPLVEETSDIGLSTMSSSPYQKNYSLSSSTSSTSDKDSPIPVISDLTEPGNLMDKKTATSAKDKPPVPRKPRNRSGNLYCSRSQSFQFPRRTSNSATNESVALRSSQTEQERRGSPERRKNVSFVVTDEDFGRYLSKPHGIETKMVLPYTERQKNPDLGGQWNRVTSVGKSWMERNFSPPKKPTFPSTNRQLEPEDIRLDERQSSVPKNHQNLTESTAVIRRLSDRRDRLDSEVAVTFGSNRNVSRIAAKDTITERSAYRDLSDSAAARVSNRPRGIDSHASENLTISSYSRMPRSTTKDSAEPLAGTQPLHRHIQEGRYQSETSQRDVETDLELAKKFEAFNVRLAAMASAAAAKRSPRSTCSDTGKPFGSYQKGKWMSSDSIFEECGNYDTKAASVFEGENKSLWKSDKPETDKVNYQKGNLGAGTPRGVLRSRSEADNNMKAKYQSFLESRSRLASAEEKSANRDDESLKENPPRTNNSTVSSKSEQDQRLSSSFADLNRGSRGDEFASRTPDSEGGSYTSLEKSDTHRSGSERGLFRSHSRGEYDQFDPKPKKTLQEQGEELQRQFSRWHRILQVSEKSRSFFDQKEKQEENSRQPGTDFLSGRYQNGASLAAVPESERLQNQPSERTAVRMGTKPIVRRPISERKVQETNWDPTKTSDESPQNDWNELASVGSLGKKLGGRPLRRSLSCALPRTDLFPRTAMAKFNDDGTPKSILKKSIAVRSQSAIYKAKEEEVEDDDYGLEGTENTDDTVPQLLNSSPPPPLISSDPPDLPSNRQTTQPSPIPSYLPPPQSPNLPGSPPPPFPSSHPPTSPSQTRTSPLFPPPLPPSSLPRLPSSLLPPSSPRRLSSFFSPTLPPSPPQSSKSPSPVPLLLPSPSSPPLPSTSPPPLPCRSFPSDVSSSSVSPGSDVSNSSSIAWSPDSGSSKFLGLQNLQKRTAILKKRSRSDLGATASILDASDQH